MQALRLLDTEPLPLPGGEEAIRFKLSDKARRLLLARQECGPTHRTPYVGEYCWLIVHECAGGKDIYPYLGAAPPDLAKVVERREDVSREGEHFHVSCHPLDGYLSDEECLLIADTHHMSP